MDSNFFPSRTLTFYLAKLFVSRVLAILVMLVLVLQMLDLLSESGDILAVKGNGEAQLWYYVSLRMPQLVARFLPYSVLLATLLTFWPLNQNSEVIAMRAADYKFALSTVTNASGQYSLNLAAGDWLFREGDAASGLFVVRAGRLEVVGEEADAGVLRVLGRGAAGGRMRGCGADYLAYALLDYVIDCYFPLVERFADQVCVNEVVTTCELGYIVLVSERGKSVMKRK